MRENAARNTRIICHVEKIEVYTVNGKETLLFPKKRNYSNCCLIECRQISEEDVDNKAAFVEQMLRYALNAKGVAELAALSKYNKRTLTRYFNKYLGTSPYQWLLEHRKNSVIHYLQCTDIKLEELAVIMGYKSKHSLTMFCRNFIGATPLEIRKKRNAK